MPKTRRTHAERLTRTRADHEQSIQALRAQLTRLVEEGRDEAPGDFSEEGGDPDAGAVERDRIRARLAETEEFLVAVRAAEGALEDGTYGTCRVCGDTIPEERLEVLPTTLLCVRCKAAGHTA